MKIEAKQDHYYKNTNKYTWNTSNNTNNKNWPVIGYSEEKQLSVHYTNNIEYKCHHLLQHLAFQGITEVYKLCVVTIQHIKMIENFLLIISYSLSDTMVGTDEKALNKQQKFKIHRHKCIFRSATLFSDVFMLTQPKTNIHGLFKKKKKSCMLHILLETSKPVLMISARNHIFMNYKIN